jgi:LysM repeat protein
MKKQLLTVLFIFILAVAAPQSADLIIKKGSKGFYVEHTVAPKQGLFPIGRLYNVHPRHIAAFNNLDFNKGLAIGQVIHIPLSDTNFSQTVNKGVPVYYRVDGNESLANISIKNRKLLAADLRQWNNLSVDNVPAGTKLIVGFLITSEMKDKVVTVTEKMKETPPAKEEKEQGVAEITKPEPEVKKEEPVVVKEKADKGEVKKDESVVVKEPPMKTETKKEEPVTRKTEEKPDAETGGSYFKQHFDKQVKQWPVTKDQTVTSGIFKTTSGWEDRKYYLLAGGIEPGTIVRVINPSNNKIVFAKVLSGMEVIRPNQGLDVRISDAAAAALAISETDKFIVKMNY